MEKQSASFLQTGLSNAEASARLAREGFNELPRSEQRTAWRILLEVLHEPMLLLLLVGGGIYLVLGDTNEALILLVFACLTIVISVVQENRSEHVLETLRELSSPRAEVIRDGQRARIAGREVVRGDLIILDEGDRVPADALLLEGSDLQTDESLLTGESVPVRKIAAARGAALTHRPGGDDLPYVYSGSLVVRGRGLAEVLAIGTQTEMGKIGQSLKTVEVEQPRLKMQIRRLVGVFAIIAAIVCVLAVILYGMQRGQWLDSALGGIALGMSMLPEEFPVVLTVFMAMGAWRISRASVLTRRAAAIETLGSATVLCTDKTGTLTENRMTIAALWRQGDVPSAQSIASLSDDQRALIEFGILASAPMPSDPMEKAFHQFGRQSQVNCDHQARLGWELARVYGLTPDLLALSHAWQAVDSDAFVIAAKGAPEAIAGLCHLDAAKLAALRQAADAMAGEGMRVLGIAKGSFEGALLPETQRSFEFEFLGLVGLADPIRPSVPPAIRECRSAGIRVIMITGDYPATARAIARQAGLDGHEVVSGDALETMSDADLALAVRNADVFARIMPKQKLRIVNALKASGETVAMTGDGVNDAPSLKAAHIGLAMGGRGTDVAREAAALVLLNDDFGSIVKAIRLGRRIYDNLRKAMCFIFAVHILIAGMALLPVLFGLPILFAPVHIAFLEMVIDPVCTLVFEAEADERDVMQRPPRAPGDPIFSKAMAGWSLLQGLSAFLATASMFVFALWRGLPENEARAFAFFSIVLVIVSLILVNRSFSASLIAAMTEANAFLAPTLGIVAAMLSLTLLVPGVRALFRFGPLHGDDLAMTLGSAVLVLLVLDLFKPLWRAKLVSASQPGSG